MVAAALFICVAAAQVINTLMPSERNNYVSTINEEVPLAMVRANGLYNTDGYDVTLAAGTTTLHIPATHFDGLSDDIRIVYKIVLDETGETLFESEPFELNGRRYSAELSRQLTTGSHIAVALIRIYNTDDDIPEHIHKRFTIIAE